ncbi:hypothetical protein [Thiocystis violacea]|uniref:hypothetical protein n=1 Tax=Thiocystis violacea TaxID=13725 RepID=UPI001905A2A4|nr:hypothetical protein [Thiocystis violacea]MBK1716928.1 hypothetical protein [Thiocystis violacea]
MISCKTMRALVVLSASSLILGTLLLLVAETATPMALMAHAALLLVFGGALFLGLALVIAVLPGNARRLGNCQH